MTKYTLKPDLCRTVLACIALTLVACSPSIIELTPEGNAVQIFDPPGEVQGCESLGKVQGNARIMIGDVEPQRDANARNKAAAMKGNRVIRGDVLLLGSRSYDVYRCPNAAAAPSPAESSRPVK